MDDIEEQLLRSDEDVFRNAAGLEFRGSPLTTSFAHYDLATRMIRARDETGVNAALTVVWTCLQPSEVMPELDSEFIRDRSDTFARRVSFRDDYAIAPNTEAETEAVTLAAEIWEGWTIPDTPDAKGDQKKSADRSPELPISQSSALSEE